MSELPLVKVERERPLTKNESRLFTKLDQEIKSDIREIEKRLLRLTRNVATIKVNRLYRGRYGSFEEYIRDTFGKERDYGYKLNQAYNVLSGLLDEGIQMEALPNNERICRELARVKDKRDRKMIWDRANRLVKESGKPVDHKDVEKVIDESAGESEDGDSNERQSRETREKQIKKVLAGFVSARNILTVNLDLGQLELDQVKGLEAAADDLGFRIAIIRKQIKEHLAAESANTAKLHSAASLQCNASG